MTSYTFESLNLSLTEYTSHVKQRALFPLVNIVQDINVVDRETGQQRRMTAPSNVFLRYEPGRDIVILGGNQGSPTFEAAAADALKCACPTADTLAHIYSGNSHFCDETKAKLNRATSVEVQIEPGARLKIGVQLAENRVFEAMLGNLVLSVDGDVLDKCSRPLHPDDTRPSSQLVGSFASRNYDLRSYFSDMQKLGEDAVVVSTSTVEAKRSNNHAITVDVGFCETLKITKLPETSGMATCSYGDAVLRIDQAVLESKTVPTDEVLFKLAKARDSTTKRSTQE